MRPTESLAGRSSEATAIGSGDVSQDALCSVEIFEKIERVSELAEDWKRLAREEPAFQSYGWNIAWAKHFKTEGEFLAIFVLRRNRTVVGILPCYRKGRDLRLLGDTTCDFQDAIAESDSDAAKLLRAAFAIAAKRGERFHFIKLSERGRLHRLVTELGESPGVTVFHKRYGRCPWFELGGSAEESLAMLKSSVRKRIRRALRRLDDLAPGHAYVIAQDAEASSEDIERIGRLHQRNQHRKSGDSIFADPRFCRFLVDVAASEDAGMRILEIRNAKGETVAFDLGFEKADRFQAYLGTYDEPYSVASPGMCLLHWQMDVLPMQGTRVFDFLCGEEEYKFDYATDCYRIDSVRVFPPGIGNRICLLRLRLREIAKHFLKPLLARVGLL